jgi:transcription initiation factor IIE alpha subunit
MTNEDAIEIIETFRLIFDSPEVENKEVLLGAIDKAIEALKNERPHGEWESGGFCFSAMSYKCPFCKSKTLERTKFCSECGADMRGEDNDKV